MLRQQAEEDIFLMEVLKMNRKTIVASLNKIANALDNNGLYTEANTVTKVMSKIAMDFDERDYNNDKMDGMDLMKEDYMPYGDPDGDDDDDDMEEPSMYQEFHGGMDEIQDMMNPGSEYSKPLDLYESYSKKPYDPVNPEHAALQDVFDDLDRMLDNYMLSDKQKAKYEQIKKRLMHISRPIK